MLLCPETLHDVPELTQLRSKPWNKISAHERENYYWKKRGQILFDILLANLEGNAGISNIVNITMQGWNDQLYACYWWYQRIPRHPKLGYLWRQAWKSCRNTYLMSVSLCVQHCPKTEAHDNLKKEKQWLHINKTDKLVFTSVWVGVIITVVRELTT